MREIRIDSEDAAGILGVKTAIRACKIMRDAGVEPVLAGGSIRNHYLARDVVQVALDRRREALARHRNDPAAYAREVRDQLRPPPPETVTLIDGRKVPRNTGMKLTANQPDPLVMIGPDAVMAFGSGVIKAAAADLKPGLCRFCVAKIHTPWGGLGPDLSEACTVLLGQPCLKCLVDLTPPKRQKTAGKRSVRRSPGRTAGGGPDTPNHYRSESQRALGLADVARAKGDHAGSARLRGIAAEYARKAGS